jgi:hypothetical protein
MVERGVRIVLLGHAVAFAVVGSLFLIFPDGTVAFINAVGRPLGFPDAPASALRFWWTLGLGYMVMVTLLAVLAARAPRARAHLLPILAAGKGTSSFLCFASFVGGTHAFLYLLNGLVDGTIAVVVLGAWTALWATDPDATARDAPLRRAVLDALVPRGGAFTAGAADVDLDAALVRYFERMHALGPAGLRLLVWAIEWGAVVFERTRPFSRLDPADRERALAAWEHSRLGVRRQLLASLKLLAMMHFYERPEAWAGIGFDEEYLRAKLLAGPNAAAHAARLGVPT